MPKDTLPEPPPGYTADLRWRLRGGIPVCARCEIPTVTEWAQGKPRLVCHLCRAYAVEH